jgi:hypothetical protein
MPSRGAGLDCRRFGINCVRGLRSSTTMRKRKAQVSAENSGANLGHPASSVSEKMYSLDMPDELEEKLGWLGIVAGNPPPTLYHYTSMGGLLGIVGTGRIHASDIQYLNDQSESDQIWNALQNRIKRKIAGATKSNSANLREILDAIERRRASDLMVDAYVASFSEVGDSLSQWRAYSTDGIGFSVGFDSACLRMAYVPDTVNGKPTSIMAQIAKVRYLSVDDDQSIDSIIEAVSEFAQAALSVTEKLHQAPEAVLFSDSFGASVKLVAPIFKHDAFSEEREWRLIISKTLGRVASRRFRAGKSMLIPYVEAEPKLEGSYFIREVIVGPTPHPALSKEAVASLFDSIGGPEVLIRNSNVPYRHW